MLTGFLWLETLKMFLASGKPVPWSFVHSWNCINCGECCKRYVVELDWEDWVNITRFYGQEVTTPSLGCFKLKKRIDGSCIFLYRVGDKQFCGIQNLKPKPCKLWPFYVREKPVFGFPELAKYRYGHKEFYIYVDTFCRGLSWGIPSKHLTDKILPEIVEIKLGKRIKQTFSTARIYQPSYQTTNFLNQTLSRNPKFSFTEQVL